MCTINDLPRFPLQKELYSLCDCSGCLCSLTTIFNWLKVFNRFFSYGAFFLSILFKEPYSWVCSKLMYLIDLHENQYSSENRSFKDTCCGYDRLVDCWIVQTGYFHSNKSTALKKDSFKGIVFTFTYQNFVIYFVKSLGSINKCWFMRYPMRFFVIN